MALAAPALPGNYYGLDEKRRADRAASIDKTAAASSDIGAAVLYSCAALLNLHLQQRHAERFAVLVHRETARDAAAERLFEHEI